ncbi:MAG: hypothetical protein HY901_18145 [Deltaproteobacteria bacterium]|nr:hypothetical protein [Deltaproteobacteria bacterium]
MAPKVSWNQLKHAYGAASDVPEVLSALDSPDRDVRLRAQEDLEARIAHQHAIYSASGPVVPLLLERLERQGAPDRDGLARILSLLAWGHGEDTDVEAVTEALDAATPRLASLLNDPAPEVRRALAAVVSAVARRNALLVQAVARRIRIETEASPLFALAMAPAISRCREPSWLEACEALLAAPLPEHRLIGAAALASALAERAPEAVVGPILEALADPSPFEQAWVLAPWSSGKMVADLANAASFLGPQRRFEVLPALAAAMERGGAAPEVAEAMLYMSFAPDHAPKDAGQIAEGVVRDALKRLVKCDAAWTARTVEVLGLAKLPGSRAALRSWLGL